MKRHAKSFARENAMKIIYSNSIEKKTQTELALSQRDPLAIKWANYIIENEAEFNDLIKKYLKKWTINELNPINLAIMQVAIYEMKYDTTPIAIIVNEAIEFTKTYSDEKAKGFVTYVLREIAKEVREA